MFSPYGLAGLVLALGAGAATAAALGLRPRSARAAALVVAGTLSFQLLHVFEHGLQALMWVDDPAARPWMSSWAMGTANGAADWFSFLAPADRQMVLGMELLHLFGNVIFLAGLAVMVTLPHLAGRTNARRALWVQSAHVAEHVLLTGTLILTGTASGVSTMLDDVLPISSTTGRVLFHFLINAVGTFYAVAAVRDVGWRPWMSVLRPTPSLPTDPRQQTASSRR